MAIFNFPLYSRVLENATFTKRNLPENATDFENFLQFKLHKSLRNVRKFGFLLNIQENATTSGTFWLCFLRLHCNCKFYELIAETSDLPLVKCHSHSLNEIDTANTHMHRAFAMLLCLRACVRHTYSQA